MTNPLFKQHTSQLNADMNRFKTALMHQPAGFIDKMISMAKSKGIPQSDIDAGIHMLKMMGCA